MEMLSFSNISGLIVFLVFTNFIISFTFIEKIKLVKFEVEMISLLNFYVVFYISSNILFFLEYK